jgi:hypothetical protein
MHHSHYAGWMIKELGIGSCYEPDPGDHHDTLSLELPQGRWTLRWVDPITGKAVREERVAHAGGRKAVTTPAYRVDIALEIRRERG